MDRTCTACGQAKPVDEFYRHAKGHDGRLSQCKACVCARVRQHRRENESVREYDRERAKTPKRRANARRITLRWRDENEAAYKAQTAVGNAIRDGKLKKEPCMFCGTDKRLHAHHFDYAKPLDVAWVCGKCHHRLHALERRKAEAA